jgi:hypothetical protein
MTEFFCDVFGWGCEQYGEAVTRAAPEINAAALLSACMLILGGCAILRERRR